jgi:hypothetical protein
MLVGVRDEYVERRIELYRPIHSWIMVGGERPVEDYGNAGKGERQEKPDG